MESETIHRLVGEYESAVTAWDQPFDGSGDWRLRVNEAATRMVVIAREIAAAGPPAVQEFATLVRRGNEHVSLWAAHHLLDFMDPDPATRDAAMGVVQHVASGDTPAAAAERLWIESWRAEQQDE